MRTRAIFAVLMLCGFIVAQDRATPSFPKHFEIGLRTFFDFGPPFDFYEIFLVHSTAEGTSVERISLTPAGDACVQPAKVELATGQLPDSIPDLLGKINPCGIPEKELRRELKRCKKCSVFSGEDLMMRFQCGDQTRIIRSDILDRDLFDSAPKTPERTSWTMQLLNRIGPAVGPGPMDRPIFAIPQEQNSESTLPQDPRVLQEVSAGSFDDLFKPTVSKPSDIYRAAQIPPPVPTILLVSSTPFQPAVFVQPLYPPLAKMAHIQGAVSFTLDVNEDGTTTDFSVESGHPVLRPAVQEAVGHWKFSPDSAGHKIHSVIEFATNCPVKKE